MDPILGQIPLAFRFAPNGWTPCEGSIVSIARFQAVCALVGGDGTTPFALPDLRGKAPLPEMQYCICLQSVFPSQA